MLAWEADGAIEATGASVGRGWEATREPVFASSFAGTLGAPVATSTVAGGHGLRLGAVR
jgi:hypothetical protein